MEHAHILELLEYLGRIATALEGISTTAHISEDTLRDIAAHVT